MNDQSSPFVISLKRFLTFIPIIIIPLAGILFMISVAPYYAVAEGCKAIGPRDRKKRRTLALHFSLVVATVLSGLLVLVLYLIAPLFRFGTVEASVIGLIYGSFIIFSFFGSRT